MNKILTDISINTQQAGKIILSAFNSYIKILKRKREAEFNQLIKDILTNEIRDAEQLLEDIKKKGA